MRWWMILILILVLLPTAQACGFAQDDPPGDQQTPFPASQYDVQRLEAMSGNETLVLSLYVETIGADASMAQYVFNFGHSTWTYVLSCRSYTVDLEGRQPGCDMSRTAAGQEDGAAALERVGVLPADIDAERLRVEVPYRLFGAQVGEITDLYYGASQAAASWATPPVMGSNGTVSPVVVDTVMGDGLRVELCGDPASETPDAQVAASADATQDKDAPGLPLTGVGLAILFVRRVALF